MNPALRLAYGLAGRVAVGAARVASRAPGDSKLVRSARGRDGLAGRYEAWGAAERDRGRPLLWIHAPSVGEGLQARPVLEQLRRARPDVQVAYTHYSPSAESFAQRLRVSGLADFADYLPWDTASAVRGALDVLAPTALVFAKLDVWPILVAEAAARGVALGLVSATLAPHSARRSRLGTALLADAYAGLERVGAVDDDDAARLRALGVRADALRVTGDTRYDQVWARAVAIDRRGPLLAPLLAAARPTVVAGSTWPPDERVVLEGWGLLQARIPGARLIVAPHEPTGPHVASIERWAAARGIRVARVGAASDGATAEPAALLILDRVGPLGDLYAAADVAYVGGGFHADGLHSVLEPAAFGVPVVVGPRHGESRDARRLLAAGGAAAVRNAGELASTVGRWLADPVTRRDAGSRAQQIVVGGLGAASRSAAMVAELLERRA